MYKVTRFEYLGKHIAYVSVVQRNAYISIHNRDGLTDQQARMKFHIEHTNEVDYLIRKKILEEEKKNEGKLLLNQN